MVTMSNFHIITLDGGAASGKSTTARALAERINLMHVDTGSHYRAITHSLTLNGLRPSQVEAISSALSNLTIGYQLEGRSARLTLQGNAIEWTDLRSEAVNQCVSEFAAIPEIRSRLKDYQRSFVDIAQQRGFSGLIMEGRDIGSVILPNAPKSIFSGS